MKVPGSCIKPAVGSIKPAVAASGKNGGSEPKMDNSVVDWKNCMTFLESLDAGITSDEAFDALMKKSFWLARRGI